MGAKPRIKRINCILRTKEIKPNPRNPRTHSKAQIQQIAASIDAFGFGSPVLVDEALVTLAGWGRVMATDSLGIPEIPAVQIVGLTEAEKRALVLADNKIADNAGWDRERLAVELPDLTESLLREKLDISVTGFSPAEIDQLLTDFEENSADPDDDIDRGWQTGPLVSHRGSLWILDQHRLECGDARNDVELDRLMGPNRAVMAFLDVPYNLPVRSIGGRGRVKHPEFAFASGEMSSQHYVEFLTHAFGNASRVSRDGAVHFVCCDWRHVTEIMEAGRHSYADTLNIVVWVKSNAGQGAFYRSQHEFIVVSRVGKTTHLNNVKLGRHGRSRSNVWNYRGVNTFGAGRMEELRSHPTVKPIALVADAMRDCTRRRDVVLDTFSGAGTTIVAAERVGRRAYAMELEPRYVDVAIRRWQAFTGKDALDAESGRTFDQLAEQARQEPTDHHTDEDDQSETDEASNETPAERE